MKYILLEQAAQPSFAFWFITEFFGAALVVFLLYYFFIENPKINKSAKKDEEKD